jgi:SAM-dependent methyltransferase
VNRRRAWWLALSRSEVRRTARAARSVLALAPEASRYARDHRTYAAAASRANIDVPLVPFPRLTDRTSTTPYDAHYVHQGPWVFRHLEATRPKQHVDIASYLGYLGFFAALAPTEFVDIRPVDLGIRNLTEREGSILDLPYESESLASVSCLHVVEHIGLGRYGDPLDPLGTVKACAELARVIAPGGMLYLSAPVGRPLVCFNAHRVHSLQQLREYTKPLRQISFDAVLDDGSYLEDCPESVIETQAYACGMFRFTR